MSITKLQATDLPGDALFGALVTKVNEVIAASNATVDVTAGVVPKGDATGLTDSSISIGTNTVVVAAELEVTSNLKLSAAGENYIYGSLAATSGNQNLYLTAAGTGTVRVNHNAGGLSNGGTGGLVVYGGANGATAKVTLAANGDITAAGALTVAGNIGFYGASAGAKPTVAGTIITATCGTGLRSLLDALDLLGLINDTTTDV